MVCPLACGKSRNWKEWRTAVHADVPRIPVRKALVLEGLGTMRIDYVIADEYTNFEGS